MGWLFKRIYIIFIFSITTDIKVLREDMDTFCQVSAAILDS